MSFSPAAIDPLGAGTDVSVAASDVNGDHTLDLTAGGKVLLGNPDGTFQPARDIGDVITPAPVQNITYDYMPHDSYINAAGGVMPAPLARPLISSTPGAERVARTMAEISGHGCEAAGETDSG